MCHSSSAVPENRRIEAVHGAMYRVKNIADAPAGHGRAEVIPALVEEDTPLRRNGAPASVVCMEGDTPIRVIGIPLRLQMLGLPDTADAVFEPGDVADYIVLGGQRIGLDRFIDDDVRIMLASPEFLTAAAPERTRERVPEYA